MARFGGSRCEKEAATQEVELGAAIHRTLQQPKAVDLPLVLSAGAGQAKAGTKSDPILNEADGEALDHRAPQARASDSQASKTVVIPDLAGAAPQRLRTTRPHRRPSPTTLAASSSCSTRATTTAASVSRSSGPCKRCHENGFGEGSGSGGTACAIGRRRLEAPDRGPGRARAPLGQSASDLLDGAGKAAFPQLTPEPRGVLAIRCVAGVQVIEMRIENAAPRLAPAMER